MSIVSSAFLMVIPAASSPTWVQALGAGNHRTHAVDSTDPLESLVAKAKCYHMAEGPQAVHSEKTLLCFNSKRWGKKTL